MALKKQQEKFSKEEIVEILKRNVNLFRDEEEFVEYLVDLTLYLLENRLKGADDPPPAAPSRIEPVGEGAVVKHEQKFLLRRARDQELVQALSKYREAPETVCRMCGAETEGKKVCPACGNFIN